MALRKRGGEDWRRHGMLKPTMRDNLPDSKSGEKTELGKRSEWKTREKQLKAMHTMSQRKLYASFYF